MFNHLSALCIERLRRDNLAQKAPSGTVHQCKESSLIYHFVYFSNVLSSLPLIIIMFAIIQAITEILIFEENL